MASHEDSPRIEESAQNAELELRSGQELDLLARQALAVRATEAVAEILARDVTVSELLRLSEDGEDPEARLMAVRALRCIVAISRQDSAVVRAVGEDGVYHYVEAVMDYGAGQRTYLALMEADELSPEETTSLYALRELVAEQADGHRPGFPTLHAALQFVGISPQEAAADPDRALAAMQEGGCFADHMASTTFSRPLFFPRGAGQLPPLGPDIDSMPPSVGATEWLRQHFEGSGVADEEAEG